MMNRRELLHESFYKMMQMEKSEMLEKQDLQLLKKQIRHQTCHVEIYHREPDAHSKIHRLRYPLQQGTGFLGQVLKHPANISRTLDISGNEIFSFRFDSEVHLTLPFSAFHFYDTLRLNHFHIYTVFALNLVCASNAKIEESRTDAHSLESVAQSLLLILWLLFLKRIACIVLDILLKQENQNPNGKSTLFSNKCSSALILVENPGGYLQARSNQT